MKAITIHQPYANQIITGEKRVENRTWPTRYRGRLIIHAGQGGDPTVQPKGAVIGVVTVVDCIRVEEGSELWRSLAPHVEPGYFHWLLEDPIPVDPIPTRGTQGLWTPPAPVAEAVDAALVDAPPVAGRLF